MFSQLLIDSTRKQKTHCQICGSKFQILVKQQHQCKRCLRAVCEQCGPTRKLVYLPDGTASEHRTCKECIKQNSILKSYKDHYKLRFGQDSEFVEEWLIKLNKQRKSYEEILHQYSDCLMITNENVIRLKRQSETMFSSLVSSYNYSYRHFVKLITAEYKQSLFQEKVKNVLIATYSKIKKLPYIQELVFVAIFFLCFASEAYTYFIISRIIEKIYPQYLRVKKMKKDNLLANELKIILEMYQILVPKNDRKQLQIIIQYLQQRFGQYVVTFTINMCDIANSFIIIDNMLKSGSYLSLYKGIAALLANCRDYGQLKSHSQLELKILRNVHIEQIKNALIQFEKSQVKFEINHDLFDSAEHRKLYQKFKQIQNLYQKSQQIINNKQNKIKTISKQLTDAKDQINKLSKAIIEIQQQILIYSDKLPKLAQLDEIQQKNINLSQENQYLKKQYQKYKYLTQKYQLDKNRQENGSKIWEKMKNSYAQQLVQLKTKNQIYQIQLAAKNIDFNTSMIEKNIEQKNTLISQLKQQIQKYEMDLKYYQQKNVQSNIMKNIGNLLTKNNNNNNYTYAQSNIKSASLIDSNSYVRQIEISTKMINQFKNKLNIAQKRCQIQEQQLTFLRNKCAQQQQILKNSESLNELIMGIKQQHSYIQDIQNIEILLSKETNVLKKSALSSIKQSFKKCQKELRCTILDSKMKERKIKTLQNQLNKTKNQDNLEEGLQKLAQKLKIELQDQKKKENFENECCIL